VLKMDNEVMDWGSIYRLIMELINCITVDLNQVM